jgi:hypothetical protein
MDVYPNDPGLFPEMAGLLLAQVKMQSKTADFKSRDADISPYVGSKKLNTPQGNDIQNMDFQRLFMTFSSV